ncbi:MAG: response regulator [Verrucomicrobiota bacterium]
MRILIADDDPVSRTLLAKILALHTEHTVTSVEDGAAAWALLDDASRSFDVAFIDINMPHLDGFGLLRRIRESSFLKSLEVVLCTASADRATVIKAAQLGARHYLVKPCSEAAVAAKLKLFQPAV